MESHSNFALRGYAVVERGLSCGRALAISFLALIGLMVLPPRVVAQSAPEIRFQSPTRGEIVARYADGMLTSEGMSDYSSGKFWTGSYSAKLSDLDLENVSYGTFTTEPGKPAAATCASS